MAVSYYPYVPVLSGAIKPQQLSTYGGFISKVWRLSNTTGFRRKF